VAGTLAAAPPWRKARAAGPYGQLREDGPKPLPEFVFVDAEGQERRVGDFAGTGLLINLWATWCGPCVSELPELVEINRMYRGRNFRLATISIDEPAKREAAAEMLAKNHVSGANYLSQIEGQDKLAGVLDKEWPGPVPYTLLIAPGGKVVYRKSGAIDPLELKRAIVGQIGRTY